MDMVAQTVLQERWLPVPATQAGYAALIGAYDLRVPLPASGALAKMLETPCLSSRASLLAAIRFQVARQGRGNLAQLCQNLRLALCLLGLPGPIQVDVE